MNKLVILTLVLLLLPITLAFTWPSRSIIKDISDSLAGNPVWPYDNLKNIFFYVFIPFIGSFAIFYGLLVRLKVFTLKKVNLLLAIVFSMSMLYYGALTYIVSLCYSIGGFITVIAFFVIFGIGVFKFGKGKKDEWEKQAEDAVGISKSLKRARKELKETEDELRIVREDLTDTRSPSRIKQLKGREENLIRRVDSIRKNIVGMKTKGEELRTDLITGDNQS